MYKSLLALAAIASVGSANAQILGFSDFETLPLRGTFASLSLAGGAVSASQLNPGLVELQLPNSTSTATFGFSLAAPRPAFSLEFDARSFSAATTINVSLSGPNGTVTNPISVLGGTLAAFPSPRSTTFLTSNLAPWAIGAYTLTFTGNSVGTLRLDNVGVTAVPEPGTYGLMLAGLAAIGVVGWRRRNATPDGARA